MEFACGVHALPQPGQPDLPVELQEAGPDLPHQQPHELVPQSIAATSFTHRSPSRHGRVQNSPIRSSASSPNGLTPVRLQRVPGEGVQALTRFGIRRR